MTGTAAAVLCTIKDDLPKRLFRVETEDGTAIIAGLSPQAARLAHPFKPGDRVEVRPAPYDPARGTILRHAPEFKTAAAAQSAAELETDQKS